jgi:ABC-type Zn uptake system ZnuABC Zn-binding protein ZnuA
LGQAVGAANPHTWLDPTLAAYGVTNILRALQQVDPLNSEGYARNARAFLKRLAALDQDLAAGTATLRSVPFITLHDAFPYFVRRYGLELVGVVKMAPDVEPSPRQLSLLYGVIRQQQAQVLFKESSDRSRLPEQIARDTNIRLAELDTLETGHLTPDAYEEGLRHNLRVLQEHLAAPRLR